MRPQIPRGMAAFAVQAVPAVPAVQPVQALAGASAESIQHLAASSRAAQYLLMAASSLSGTAPEGDALNAPAVAPAAARVTRPPTHPIDLAAAAALYAEVTTTGDPTTLARLLAGRLRAAAPVETAAAAVALNAMMPDHPGAVAALARLVRSADPLARAIAETAAPAAPPAPETAAPTAAPAPPAPPAPTRSRAAVSTTVHGTFAMLGDTGSRWYIPGAPLHDHLEARVGRNLYDGPGFFTWSGQYSDSARRAAGDALVAWTSAATDAGTLDVVYAHSHGGTVALNAASVGQRIRVLVLMHVPAVERMPGEWAAIRRAVDRVIVLRTRFDLVVLADTLASRLRPPRSRTTFAQTDLPHELVDPTPSEVDAPIDLFSHDYFLRVPTWERERLADLVRRQSSSSA
ncbi:hypothetical protein [Microbacterium aurantiacum]|uniref:Alpha/beta hydrolase n=1 Tax=Microbacterium aurantiacum TaxID=162393 RepID=A0ABT8FW49_9MICO|nr:hypothetical protein [Microbacterium aurantiacum]MDN4465097.1 hypothetical protein [Microbacterium aurantiacum]